MLSSYVYRVVPQKKKSGTIFFPRQETRRPSPFKNIIINTIVYDILCTTYTVWTNTTDATLMPRRLELVWIFKFKQRLPPCKVDAKILFKQCRRKATVSEESSCLRTLPRQKCGNCLPWIDQSQLVFIICVILIIIIIMCSFLCHFSFGVQGPLHETK